MIITETSVFQSVDDGNCKRDLWQYQTTKIPRQKCKFELLL
jgi:hypothetical protein